MEQAAKSDAELIREALSDADAFGVLYGRHVQSIHQYLRGRAPEDAAMELTAETFAQAALGLRRFRDLADGSARPWLHGIARNLLSAYWERERVETSGRRRLGLPLSAYDDQLAEVEERATDGERAAVRGALEALPPTQRHALTLRVVEERSYADVASILGCSEVAARLRVMRALGSLSRLFEGAAP